MTSPLVCVFLSLGVIFAFSLIIILNILYLNRRSCAERNNLLSWIAGRMGAYLSVPVLEKDSTGEEGEHLSYGASSMQGWRVSQEVIN